MKNHKSYDIALGSRKIYENRDNVLKIFCLFTQNIYILQTLINYASDYVYVFHIEQKIA